MKWSLPLVELSRIATHCASPSFAVTVVLSACVLPFVAGCSALPVMHDAAADVAWRLGGITLTPDEFAAVREMEAEVLRGLAKNG